MFERLRDALKAALDAATPPADLRQLAGQMREAVVDAKVAVREVREALKRTEIELTAERQKLADAERRGRLAGEIQDAETVEVAGRFAAKHRERVAMLEKKLAAQQEELSLAEKELNEMQSQLSAADQSRVGAERSTEDAWREIQRAGGSRPGVDPEDDLLKSQLERAQREAAADRQLDELKKKLRKD
ncbi:MAG TPA: hypothetical protein VJS20_07670 [Gemmatimonadales bacterium]|nr:hypothetical protein [Gemmatimonadales bacterium]